MYMKCIAVVVMNLVGTAVLIQNVDVYAKILNEFVQTVIVQHRTIMMDIYRG